jgi:hypothetical protein
MSKEGLNQFLEKLMTDRELNKKVQTAAAELEKTRQNLASSVLGHFDLTAEEREAVVSKDLMQLQILGVKSAILKRADWCTGD